MKYLNANGWNLNEPRSFGGEVWLYNGAQSHETFVGRFKYRGPVTSAKSFAKFLTANFTPAEYFAERAKGIAPLTILEAKGYVSPNMKRVIASLGARPLTTVGTCMGAKCRIK